MQIQQHTDNQNAPAKGVRDLTSLRGFESLLLRQPLEINTQNKARRALCAPLFAPSRRPKRAKRTRTNPKRAQKIIQKSSRAFALRSVAAQLVGRPL